jgi:hypothetical protein
MRAERPLTVTRRDRAGPPSNTRMQPTGRRCPELRSGVAFQDDVTERKRGVGADDRRQLMRKLLGRRHRHHDPGLKVKRSFWRWSCPAGRLSLERARVFPRS